MATEVISLIRDTASNSGMTRASNVVTVNLALTFPNSNLKVGQSIRVFSASPASFNGTHVITEVVSQTSYKFAQTGVDESSAIHGSSGGHYTSMASWEGGEQGDLTLTGRDEIATAEIYDDWPTGLSGRCDLVGWTCDNTHYPLLRAGPGDECTANWADGGAYLTYNNKELILARCSDIRIERLRLEATTLAVRAYQGGVGNHFVVNCYIKTSLTGGAVLPYNGNTTTYVYGTIGVNTGTGTTVFGSGGGTVYTRNCIGYGSGTTPFSFNKVTDPRNCVGLANGDRSFYANYGTGQLTNASEDTHAPGTGSITGITAATEFEDPANGDFRLKSGSQLIGAGTNLYSDPYDTSGYAYDIEGDEWPSTGDWDIGADHYQAGGGTDIAITTTASNITYAALSAVVGVASAIVTVAPNISYATLSTTVEQQVDMHITTGVENITYSPQSTTVEQQTDSTIVTTAPNVTYTSLDSTVELGLDVAITTTAENIQYTSLPAAISSGTDTDIVTIAANIDYAGLASDISVATTITTTAENISYTPLASSVSVGQDIHITTNAEDIIYTPLSANIQLATEVQTTLQDITYNTLPSTISVDSHITTILPIGITYSPLAATIDLDPSINITTTVSNIVYQGLNAAIVGEYGIGVSGIVVQPVITDIISPIVTTVKALNEPAIIPDHIATPATLSTILSTVADNETIELANGTYSDFIFTLDQTNVSLYAGNPGSVIFDGTTRITIGGIDNTVKKLVFDSIANSDAIARFVDATDGTLSDCKFLDCGTDAYNYRQIIQVHRSSGSIIEHNYMTGNDAMGIGVVLKVGQTVPTGTIIRNNHVTDVAVDNGKEVIQIGQGDRYDEDTDTLITGNILERCDGDSEAISVKTGDVDVDDNLILDSAGYIVFRQGNGSTATNNCVSGCDVGIRVHGKNHSISNNLLVENTLGLVVPAGASTFASDNALHDAASNCTFSNNALVSNGTDYSFDAWYDGGTYDTYPTNNSFTSDLASKFTAEVLIDEAQDVFTWTTCNFTDLDYIMSSTPDVRFSLIDNESTYLSTLRSNYTALSIGDSEKAVTTYGASLLAQKISSVGVRW